jgi:hypothetical protein
LLHLIDHLSLNIEARAFPRIDTAEQWPHAQYARMHQCLG